MLSWASVPSESRQPRRKVSIMATKPRMSVSTSLALIDKLRSIVALEQSPVARMFDVERAGKGKIVDAALEVACWVSSGGFHKDLLGRWAPEFQQRLHDTDRNAFLRGVQSAASFLGAEVEIDAERGLINIIPANGEDVEAGEIDPRPLIEPKAPRLH